MKIVHIVRQFYPMIGGIENYVMSLAALQSKNHEVTVITLDRSFMDGKQYPLNESIGNIPIIRIPYKGSNRYPLAPSVLKYLKPFDVVHVHCVDFFMDYLALTKWIHRKKIILTTHGGFFHTAKFGLIKKIFFNFVTRFTIKLYDQVIACGESDYNTFSKISNSIVQIDNGVNTQPYLETEKKVVPGEIVYIGRIDVHKRIDNLIKLIAHLSQRNIKAHLAIVGPDWNRQQDGLVSLANTLDVSDLVEFRGAISNEELIRAYSKAKLFVSASEYEGFGLTAIEALASGTPCVLHNNESFSRLFINKPFAIISDFSDLTNTANKVVSILSMPESDYNQLCDEGRKFAKKYSWNETEQKITNLYS